MDAGGIMGLNGGGTLHPPRLENARAVLLDDFVHVFQQFQLRPVGECPMRVAGALFLLQETERLPLQLMIEFFKVAGPFTEGTALGHWKAGEGE